MPPPTKTTPFPPSHQEQICMKQDRLFPVLVLLVNEMNSIHCSMLTVLSTLDGISISTLADTFPQQPDLHHQSAQKVAFSVSTLNAFFPPYNFFFFKPLHDHYQTSHLRIFQVQKYSFAGQYTHARQCSPNQKHNNIRLTGFPFKSVIG